MLAMPALASAQALTAISIGGVPEESATPALWARQSGIFRRSGLDVTIEPQNSGSAISAAVVGGSYAIGKSSLVSLIIAHAKGVPFVLVAGGGLYDAKNPNFGLVVKADSPLKTAADLNGKSVAVSALNDLYAIGTKAWMDKNGGDSSTIKFLELPISAVADAIAQPTTFAGIKCGLSTNATDPQTGASAPAPAVSVMDGELIGQVEVWTASWNKL